jgi:hypothetical protein
MKSWKRPSVFALLKGVGSSCKSQAATAPQRHSTAGLLLAYVTFRSSSWYWSTQVVTSATTLGSSSLSTLQ